MEVEEIKNEQPKEAEKQAEVLKEQPKVEAAKPVEQAKAVDPWQAGIAESRKLLNVPLQAGQAYFESPEGFIMIDEATRGRVWCRQANKGQGLWINPRR